MPVSPARFRWSTKPLGIGTKRFITLLRVGGNRRNNHILPLGKSAVQPPLAK
jgi:hypothetical protein